ncbi:hypothetical protein [Fervidobacterium islandicum]|uniref:hypothetical protein n=1 Tax=Fervidobacterium islandicum TaxID=2423 RepID=UPI003A770397
MAGRYLLIVTLYVVLLLFSSYNLKSYKTFSITTEQPSTYWFSISYDGRFWKVNTAGRIYDIYPDDGKSLLEAAPFVTGFNIDLIQGKIDSPFLKYLPQKIPTGVFEINLKEKYIVTRNSSIVYITDIIDIQSCLNTLALAWQYMDPKKVYLFKNGKIYTIKG